MVYARARLGKLRVRSAARERGASHDRVLAATGFTTAPVCVAAAFGIGLLSAFLVSICLERQVRDLMDAAMCPFTFLVVIEASKTFAAKLRTIHGYSPSASPLQLKTAVVLCFHARFVCLRSRYGGSNSRGATRISQNCIRCVGWGGTVVKTFPVNSLIDNERTPQKSSNPRRRVSCLARKRRPESDRFRPRYGGYFRE